jgi:cell filamentation protein, protein adenylyltransferase
MYILRLNRYQPRVVRALARIAAARAIIENAAILPAQEDILRKAANVGSVHYSNIIEGNELPLIEAARAVDHKLEPSTKAKLELVNYVNALEFIERKAAEGAITYTPAFLKELHGVLTRGLGKEETRFKPHHEGEWRDGRVVVRDAVMVYHIAPGDNQQEVGELMQERLDWITSRRGSDEYLPSILAAIAHFEVAEVHPFADYNGRIARLFGHAVLVREGVVQRRIFSPERYYAEDRDAYYAALRAIKRERHLDAWVAYFTEGLAHEMERAVELVQRVNAQTLALPLPVQLTTHQESIVAELTAGGKATITRAEAERLTGLKKVQTASALATLVDAGVLVRRGSGPKQRYELAVRPTRTRPGPIATWTDEKIENELRGLSKRLGHWPTIKEFRSTGSMALYQAASKAGGIRRWKGRVTDS